MSHRITGRAGDRAAWGFNSTGSGSNVSEHSRPHTAANPTQKRRMHSAPNGGEMQAAQYHLLAHQGAFSAFLHRKQQLIGGNGAPSGML